MAEFRRVRLGELLKQRKVNVSVQPTQTYKLLGVRLAGQGPFLREEKSGNEIRAFRLSPVRAGDFIYSRLFAWRGAFGLVPEEFNNFHVSNEFPTFEIDTTRVFPKYLRLYFARPPIWEEVEKYCTGTTKASRNRFKEVFFLNFEIPLPPLPEQQRIVARIEALARRVEEAHGLRQKAVEDCSKLLRAIVFDASDSSPTPTPMKELIRLREPDVLVESEKTYHFAGVYSFGEGVFKGQQKLGMEFAYRRLTRLRTNDFVYPKLMAWEGALGIVPPECDGLVVSTEFPVFEVDRDSVLPETLDIYFRTPTVWPTLSAKSTGTNVRRRRLNPKDFLEYKMLLPPLPKQLKLRAVKAKVDELRRLQSEMQKELDALMPSILAKAFAGEL